MLLLLRHYLLLLLLCLSIVAIAQPTAQSPYHFSIKRELSYGVAALGVLGGGQLLYQRIDPVPLADLELPRVSAFDRQAIGNTSTEAAALSDGAVVGSLLLPLINITYPENLREGVNLLILAAETLVINQGVTDLIKSAVRRPRPYVYRYAVADGEVPAYDRSSFPSAHTSTAAAAAFFFGRVYADYNPESKFRPVVWLFSASVPAVTAYLRVKGGQNFASDVIVGYVLGASTGYLVPTLHTKPLVGGRLSVVPSPAGVYLSYALHRPTNRALHPPAQY